MPQPTLTLQIGGMHCGACVAHVEQVIRKVPGVRLAAVNLAIEQAIVQLDEPAHNPSIGDLIIAAVTRAGYQASIRSPTASTAGSTSHKSLKAAGTHDQHPASTDDASAWRRRFLYTLPLSASVMVLGMVWMTPVSAWVQLALTIPIYAWIGGVIARRVWSGLRTGRLDMDTLILLGTTAALVLSLWRLFATGHSAGHESLGVGEASVYVYFDSTAVVLSLVCAGRWLEGRARSSAAQAIAGLASLTPEFATVVSQGHTTERTTADLQVGDEVLVRPGQRLACDGQVLSGASDIDESMLTGESVRVHRSAGEHVFAGTLNGEGVLHVRVLQPAGSTVLAQIAELTRQAQLEKSDIQRLADRVAGVFVPVVLVIAIAVVLGWGLLAGSGSGTLTGDMVASGWTRGVEAAVSVLIVACPCALGLAVPMAILVGSGVGARHGIIIKQPRALEHAGAIKTILLDKTGTITDGRFELVQMVLTDKLGDNELLRLAASVEAGSEHPIGRALVAAAQQRGIPFAAASMVTAHTGLGVSGEVEGVQVFVGMPEAASDFVEFAERVESLRSGLLDSSMYTVIAVIEGGPDGTTRGLLCLRDSPKPGAVRAIALLHQLGCDVAMVTGDAVGPARSIARQLGITEVHAGVRPEGKLELVRQAQLKGPVAMVGDGVNDAPALAAADLSIAMGNGADIAGHAADIVLVSSELANLPRAIVLSRAMMYRIRMGLVWAFGYNIVLLPVAAAGWLTPMLAAAAMSLSSVSVIANALMLRRVKLDIEPTVTGGRPIPDS